MAEPSVRGVPPSLPAAPVGDALRRARAGAAAWYRIRAIIAGALLLLVAGPDLAAFAHERSALRALGNTIVGETPDRRRVPQQLQTAVRTHVRTVIDGAFYHVERRAFLRQSALDTWVHAEGQCGEGARLLVNLLLLQGIRAARINMTNDRTGFAHTAVVYEQDGVWYFLDTISSPADFHQWSLERLRPVDSLIRFVSFPGGGGVVHATNPYFDQFSYIDLGRLFGPSWSVTRMSPPPMAVVWVLENPSLMRAILKGAVLASVLMLFGATLIIRRLYRPVDSRHVSRSSTASA